MRNFHYHILETNNPLSLVRSTLIEVFDKLAGKIVAATESVETDVVVRHSPSHTIPELGISGQYTKEARCIDIYVDIEHPNLLAHFKDEVSRTFVHEYMHVVREQYVVWENGTLLDSLIAEGLTQSFELEMLPQVPPSIYATALTEIELESAWNKAKTILDQRGYENDEWFYGNDTIKRWSGYSLGFKLVQDKIESSGKKASELYTLPSVEFLLT
jgi:hypothetical protein